MIIDALLYILPVLLVVGLAALIALVALGVGALWQVIFSAIVGE